MTFVVPSEGWNHSEIWKYRSVQRVTAKISLHEQEQVCIAGELKCPGSPHSTFVSPSGTLPDYHTNMRETPHCWGHSKWKKNLWNKPSVLCLPYNYTLKEKCFSKSFSDLKEGQPARCAAFSSFLASHEEKDEKVRIRGNFPKLNPSRGYGAEAQTCYKLEYGHESTKLHLPTLNHHISGTPNNSNLPQLREWQTQTISI